MKISTRKPAGAFNTRGLQDSKKMSRAQAGTWKRWLVAAFSMLMILGSQTGFSQLLTEDFTGSGALTSLGWTAHSGGGTAPISTTTGLSYPGALGSGVGNAAVVASVSGEDVNKMFTAVSGNGNVVYASFMVNVTDAGNKSGDYIFMLGNATNPTTFTNFAARVFVRTTASGVNFGISNTSTVTYGATNFARNTTYLCIIKYSIVTGSGNDPVSMWVKATGIPATEVAAGAADLSNTITNGQDQINALAFRQASTNHPATVFDGIRIGTTWASVTAGAAAPVINSSLTDNATVGTPYSYTITATNSPSSFGASSLPANGLNISGAVISGTPTTAGTQNINISATNGIGTDNKVLVLTVAKGNQTISGLPLTDTRTFGDASYSLSATASSGLSVTYISSDPTVATITGGNTVNIIGAGTTTITASQAGNSDWNPATNATQTLTVDKATQTITFAPLPDKNDTDGPFALLATGGASGNPVEFESSNPAVATISGNTVTITGAGTTTITATQAGNDDYLAADPVNQDQFVINTSLLSQTITFNPLADVTYGDAPFALTATGGGSGNPVTYTSNNDDVATVSGNTVTIVGPGTVTITASQAGNGSYNPASPVDQTLTVLVKNLTVSGVTVASKTYDGTDAATFSTATLVGIVGSDDVSLTGGGTFDSPDAGTHNVTANLSLTGADFAKYTLTQPTGLTGTISQAGQIISFNALPNKTFGDPDYALSATGGASGNPVTFASSDPTVLTISGNTVTIVGAGSATITASQAGNTNYGAAADVTQVQVIEKDAQFITFTALPDKVTTDAPFALTGSASSGLTVTYASSNPSVATVSGNTVTIVGMGSTNITASQSGNDDFLPANDVVRSLTVTAPIIAANVITATNPSSVNPFTSGQVVAANVTATGIGRGTGIAAASAADRYSAQGWNSTSFNALDYFEFTITPAAGFNLDFSAFNYTSQASGTGPTSFSFRSSVDNYASELPFVNGTNQVISLSAYQDITTAISFRVYGWNASGAGGTFSINDYSFSGYVQSAPPVVTFTKTNRSACGLTPDGTITLNVTGGTAPFTYSWTGVTGSGNPASTPFPNPGNVSSLTGLERGFYNVTVTDANLNSVTLSNIQIAYAFLVNVTNNASISSYCTNTGSIILYGSNGVPPYEYSLDNVTYQPTGTFTGLGAGNYIGYIRDAAGCMNSKNITLTASAPIVINPFIRPASSCGSDGSIEVYRTGGIGPYTYSTDNVTYQSSNKFLNLAAGAYTVYVKDSKGCVESASVTVTQGVGLTVTANKANSSSCINDGSIQLVVSGGIAPYTYSLDNVTYQSGNSFTDLAPNTYTGYVKDSKGCIGSVVVTITQNNIVVTAFATPASGCGMENGKIQLFRTGGVGPYTYSIDGNTYQSSNTFTGLLPGYYNGYVKDSKTCTGDLIDIYVGPDCGQRVVATSQARVKPVASATEASLTLNAYPNPSASEFTLMLKGFGKGKVAVLVTDIMGRKIYQVEGSATQQYRFGSNFQAGMYNVQVIQGNTKKSIKLIKE